MKIGLMTWSEEATLSLFPPHEREGVIRMWNMQKKLLAQMQDAYWAKWDLIQMVFELED